MSTIGITGGTGLVGTHLSRLLRDNGHDVVIFTRTVGKPSTTPRVSYAHWDARLQSIDKQALRSLDAMVNLAGAGIADRRWTDKRKKEIVSSRVDSTNFLVQALNEFSVRCTCFISASATGFYGPDAPGKVPFRETAPAATDFLGTTCQQWEAAAWEASTFVRTTLFRFGIVLGRESGAFPQFYKPISMGVKPVLGSGDQVISWIAVDDLARMLLFAIDHNEVSGIYNAVSPNPVTNREMMDVIAKVKGGFKLPVKVPAFALRLLLGEMSEEVLKSTTASADKIQQTRFRFGHPDIVSAVQQVMGK